MRGPKSFNVLRDDAGMPGLPEAPPTGRSGARFWRPLGSLNGGSVSKRLRARFRATGERSV